MVARSTTSATAAAPTRPTRCWVTIVAAVDCATSDAIELTSVASVSSASSDPDMNNNSQVANSAATNPAPVIICPTDVVQATDLGMGSAVVNHQMQQA